MHEEARKFAADGYTIVLIGHDGHEEVEGTMGEAPQNIVLVETEDDVDALEVRRPPARRVHLADDAVGRRDAHDHQPPARALSGDRRPRTDDICYATTNRQSAVKQMAVECDLVLVIGSQNSSNSQRLVDVARDYGTESYLIDNATQVQEAWLDGKRVVGISSGASAPEELVERLVAYFTERGVQDVSEFEVVREDVRFMLPKRIREDLAART